MSNRPGISFKYENTLLVSRKRLQADYLDYHMPYYIPVSPRRFQEILNKQHVAEKIDQQIEDIYKTMLTREKIAKVARPAIWAVRLSIGGPNVFNDVFAVDCLNVKGAVADRGILTTKSQEFWDVALEAGYRPDIDMYNDFHDAGMWLRLHKNEESKSESEIL